MNSWHVFCLIALKLVFFLHIQYIMSNRFCHFGFWVLCIISNAALISDKTISFPHVCHLIYFSWQVRQFLGVSRGVSPDESLSFRTPSAPRWISSLCVSRGVYPDESLSVRSAPCWMRRSTTALCLEWSPPWIFNKWWRGVWPFLSWMFKSAPAEINSWTNSKCCVTAKWLHETAQ